MKPNLFLYKNFSNEDHFTTSLGYILNLFPKIIGNRFLTKLALLAGQPINYFGEFIDAEFTGFNFQNQDSDSKPDMIINTSKTKIFFEVKLEASLSKNQLERHLKDVDKAKGLLLFVSNIHSSVSDNVINRKNYIKPKDQNHFIWADFESIFNVKIRKGNLEERLLHDFRQSLRLNGMRGRQIIGANGNLYTNSSDAEHLFLDKLQVILKEIGFSAWRPRREYTLRVNPKKSGIPPLLNPRLKSTGEFIHPELIHECLIIYCFSNNIKKARDSIQKLQDIESNDSRISFFEITNKNLRGIIYIPLKFIQTNRKYDIDWTYMHKIWQNIYDILK